MSIEIVYLIYLDILVLCILFYGGLLTYSYIRDKYGLPMKKSIAKIIPAADYIPREGVVYVVGPCFAISIFWPVALIVISIRWLFKHIIVPLIFKLFFSKEDKIQIALGVYNKKKSQ